MISALISVLYLLRAIQFGNPISIAIAVLFIVLGLKHHFSPRKRRRSYRRY